MIVDIYARVSLDRTGESLSVDNQVAACREYAAGQGWDVGTVYSDNSISATKGKTRPGFEGLVSRVQPRAVLVHNTDRLIRTMKDLERVLDTGITVHAVIAGTMDLATSQGRMVARLLTSVAQNEGELKAERMMLSYAARAAKGETMWRVKPLGHDTKGQLTEWAPFVAEAVDAVLEGRSLRSIARHWNNSGVPTTRYASEWTGASVREVLSAPRIAGVLMFKGSRMTKSQIEPIISEDKFDELTGYLSNPSRASSGPRGQSNLLSGLALCGRCDDGTTMLCTYAETIGGWGPVYRCRKGHNQHPREEADSWVYASLYEILQDDPRAAGDDSDDANSEVLRIQGQLAKWQAVATSLEPMEYLAVTEDLRKQLATARESSRSKTLADLLDGLPESTPDADYIDPAIGAWLEDIGLASRRALIDHLMTVTFLPRQRFSPGDYEDYVIRERR